MTHVHFYMFEKGVSWPNSILFRERLVNQLARDVEEDHLLMIGHVWVLGGEISRLPMTERSR